MAIVDFPAPVCPTNATVVPAGTKHFRPGAVREPDPLELNAAVDLRQFGRVGKDDDLLLLVHHVHDLVQRGDRGQKGVVEL